MRPEEDSPANDPASRKRYRKQYVQWLWPYRATLIALFVLSLATTALDVAWPGTIKLIINLLGSPRDTADKLHRLNIYAAIVVVLLVAKQVCETIRTYCTGVLNHKVTFRLRDRLYAQLMGLSLGQLGELKSGGVVSRLSSDIESISGLIQQALINPGVAVVRIVLTMAVLLAMSWKLAIAALIILPPLALSSMIWLRRVRPIYRSVQTDRSDIDARVGETFSGIRVVRSFRREAHEARSHAVGHHTIIRKSLRAQRLELSLYSLWGILIPMTMLTIVWYGGRLYLRGQVNLGDIFAFNIYLMQLLQPVLTIVSSVGQTQKSLAAMERVFETIEMPPDKPDASDATDAPAQVREIRFDEVDFAYGSGSPVIRDFSLRVPGGSVVALVGPSGAGKTTLTDLVARFHDPTLGRVLLNDLDLRKLRLDTYRKLLAVVPQEVFLFDGTIAENIAYGRRSATAGEIAAAARRANAHGFIEQLPLGYDTLVGERGFKLSGGQRQRLSIARAILADPQILILDEATSNLDSESEQLIQAALDELLQNRTTFVIAHRLSTVVHADIIVAMEAGRIREVGTHAELIARRGFYYLMVERQRESLGSLAAAG